MSERVWHKGPPLFPGWWNASGGKDEEAWRWWNGHHWSEAAFPSMSTGTAAHQAGRKNWTQKLILWTDYWPENARVPRLDPTGGHWTFNVDGKKPEDLPEAIDLALRDGTLMLGRPSSYWDWELIDDPRDAMRMADILAWRPAA